MPKDTSLTNPTEFQPFLIGVPPATKKDYGKGIWEVECANCGEKRLRQTYKVKKTGRIIGSENLCSKCATIKFFHKRIPLKCPVCGVVRMMTITAAKQRLSSYCKSCFKKSGKPRITSGRHTCKTGRGYVVVLGMMGHPLANRNQIREHWLVLYEQHQMGPEQVLWFRDHGFTVHHKNGVRDDNRLENLELRARGKHPNGWTIEEMEEVIRRYRNGETANAITRPPSI